MSSSEGDILIITSEQETSDYLGALLMGEGYQIESTNSQQLAFEILGKKPFNLVVSDFLSANVAGIDICKHIRGNFNLRHMSIILIIDTKDPMDKIKGIYAGADDYVEKPFEPGEFLARVKASLVRITRDLDANPLTKLPGNISLLKELEARIKLGSLFAVGYIDLNKFKEFNDVYGFQMGDKVIYHTAQVTIRNLEKFGNTGDFLGHIGGDDFIFITTPEKAEDISRGIVDDFDKSILSFYNEDDKQRGYIITKNRTGEITEVPLLSVSIGIVTNEIRQFSHVGEIGQIAAELKKFAKAIGGSVYVKDRRKA
jgi:diguanylate cyclase (GGDEF)-like protein